MDRPKRENIMLCYPVDAGRIARLGEKFFVQPKLNGERCRIEWFHGEPVMLSSYGNAYKGLEHIQKDILDLAKYAGQAEFDGELYRHDWSWSKIRSVASREVNRHPDAEQLQYHIFDTQNELRIQVDRLLLLQKSFEKCGERCGSLKLVQTYVCTQNEQWEYAKQFVLDGYEGIILRDPLAYYHKKRNVCMLKYKPTESDEYEIVKVLEEVSKNGEAKNMAGAFLVKGDDGTVFKVGAGKITHTKRKELWQKSQKLTGKLLRVKHEKLRTINSVPVGAVAVEVLE